jgi:hypothetical protein
MEGFCFTETASAVILMLALPYVNQYRYNSIDLLSLRGGFGDPA